jgi:ribosome-associated translation inhibitor RaiA
VGGDDRGAGGYLANVRFTLEEGFDATHYLWKARGTRGEPERAHGRTVQPARPVVEANVSIRRGNGIHAGAEASDFRTAVDRTYEKLSRQLKSRREKVRDHKAVPEIPIRSVENTTENIDS